MVSCSVNSSVDLQIFNEYPKCRDGTPTKSLPFPIFSTSDSKKQDFTTNLVVFRVRTRNRVIKLI